MAAKDKGANGNQAADGRNMLRPRTDAAGTIARAALTDAVSDAQTRLTTAANKLNSINTGILTPDEYDWLDNIRDDALALTAAGKLVAASDPNAVDSAMTQPDKDAKQATEEAVDAMQGIMWDQLNAASRQKVLTMLGRIEDACRGVAIAVTRRSS